MRPVTPWKLVVVALSTALTVSVSGPTAAVSTIAGPGATTDRNIMFVMAGDGWDVQLPDDDQSATPRTRRQAARDGMLRWNEPRDHDGRRYATIWSTVPPGTYRRVDVRVQALSATFCGVPAVACFKENPDTIYVSDAISDAVTFDHATAHEMGHALGLPHSGSSDVHTQHIANAFQTPLMSVCTDYYYANLMDEDDASIARNRAALRPRPIGPNVSVETGRLYPWRSSGNPVSVVTTSSSDGVYHLMVAPNSQYDNVNNAVNFDTAEGKLISARLNYLTPGGVGGSVRMAVEARYVYYGAVATGSCAQGQYPTGRDENTRTNGGWTTVLQASFPPSASWTWRDTGTWQVPPHGDFDVRIRIFSTVTASAGGYIHVHYDNARVREH